MQLGEGLNLDTKVDLQSLSGEEIQTYIQFFMQVIQATADSSGNFQVVYRNFGGYFLPSPSLGIFTHNTLP
jgi:hypothetical protein